MISQKSILFPGYPLGVQGGLQKFPFLPANGKQELQLRSSAQAMEQMVFVTPNQESQCLRMGSLEANALSESQIELSDHEQVT